MLPIEPPDYIRDDFTEGEGWADFTFTMPEGLEGEDLPTLVNIEANIVVSFWQPNELEQEAISKGHVVCLRVIGSQPPVSLSVL